MPFDHLMARASNAWAWGGPDVIDFFPAPNTHLDAFPYHHYHSLSDASDLDRWVADRYFAMLEDAKKDPVLMSKIKFDGAFFFLHLAGVDTNGHRFGPHSVEYRKNTQLVDSLIRQIVEKSREFFSETDRIEDTLFIFTSDHGFQNGHRSHGDASPETRTCPLVIWGGRAATSPSSKTCSDFKVNQRELASFMAVSLGRSIPSHNAAAIPIKTFFNWKPIKEQSEMSLLNLQQIFAAIKHHHMILSRRDIIYRIFGGGAFERASAILQKVMNSKDYSSIVSSHDENVKKMEQLLENIVNHDKIWMRIALLLQSVALLSFFNISSTQTESTSASKSYIPGLFASLLVCLFFFFIKGLATYSIYFAIPLLLLARNSLSFRSSFIRVLSGTTFTCKLLSQLLSVFIFMIFLVVILGLATIDRRFLVLGWTISAICINCAFSGIQNLIQTSLAIAILSFSIIFYSKNEFWNLISIGFLIVLFLAFINSKRKEWLVDHFQIIAFCASAALTIVESFTGLSLHLLNWIVLVLAMSLFMVSLFKRNERQSGQKFFSAGLIVATISTLFDNVHAGLGSFAMFACIVIFFDAIGPEYKSLDDFSTDELSNFKRLAFSAGAISLIIVTSFLGWHDFIDIAAYENGVDRAGSFMFGSTSRATSIICIIGCSILRIVGLLAFVIFPSFKSGEMKRQHLFEISAIAMFLFNSSLGLFLFESAIPLNGRWVYVGAGCGRIAIALLTPVAVFLVLYPVGHICLSRDNRPMALPL